MLILGTAKNFFKKLGDFLCSRGANEDAIAEHPHIPPAPDTLHFIQTLPATSTDPTTTAPETTSPQLRAHTTPPVQANNLLSISTRETAANTDEDQVLSNARTNEFLKTFQKTYSEVQEAFKATSSLPSRTKDHIRSMHLYMGAFFDACYHSTFLPDALACDDPAIDRIIEHYFREAVKKVTPPILGVFDNNRYSFRPFPAPSVTYKILRDDFQDTPIEHLPFEQRWRFAMEPDVIENMHHFGILKEESNFLKPLLYENEIGYFHRMVLTWKDVCSKKIGEKLTVDDIINWNNTCNGEDLLSPSGVRYTLPKGDNTSDGRVEINQLIESCKNDDGEDLLWLTRNDDSVHIQRWGTTKEHLKKIMGQLIDDYYQEIEQLDQHTSEGQHLQVAVKLVQKLHRIHPFGRGNGRTFYIFTLNKLLLDQGLPMSIPNDLWKIDGSSVEEGVEIVKEGQKYLKKFRTQSTSQTNQWEIPPVAEAKAPTKDMDFVASTVVSDRQQATHFPPLPRSAQVWETTQQINTERPAKAWGDHRRSEHSASPQSPGR